MRVVLVVLAACGRLDFDPMPRPATFSIASVTPAWAMTSGGPTRVTLDRDATGFAIAIDGVPCGAPSTQGATIACTAPAHAAGDVIVTATSDAGEIEAYAKRFVYVAPGPYQYGGPLDDRTSGVATDSQGNVVVTGATTGGLDGANQGDFDAVVVKYDASGQVAWVRQLGTPLFDYARDVAIDPSDDITITGYTAGALHGANAGLNDVFVARYTPDGTLAWVAQLGSAGDDQAWDLGVDAAGNTVVAIQTTGDLGGANAGGQDYAIARFNADGTLAWVKQAGTAADDFGHSVAVAPDGTAYLVGWTTGALAGANAGGDDMFVARYNADGTRAWIHQRGGAGSDDAEDVQYDGDVWIAGNTSATLDGTTSGGGQDIFAMHFDTAGNWLWTRQFGGTGGEATFGIFPGPSAVYTECNTTAAFDGQPYLGGVDDFCVIAFDRSGSHLWTRIAGGPASDEASSLAVDRALTGFIYVSLITTGALASANAGGNDIAVAKFDATGAQP